MDFEPTPRRGVLRPETARLGPPTWGSRAPFAEQLEEHLLGQHIIVESENGRRFEGELRDIQPRTREVLLTDVEAHPSGAPYTEAFVANVDWIVGLPADGDHERDQ